jgi:RNA polymerase sigma factor (sigma-70 family)
MCLSGDQAAWKALVNRYARLVYSIPQRYGFPAQDADDIFQNVFTIAYQQLASLRDQKLLAAWLITITRRQCQRMYKSTRATVELPESLTDPSTSTSQDMMIWEIEHLVHDAILQLDPQSQKLVQSLFLDPQSPSYAEIAASLNIPVGSIGPYRARCLKKLATILEAMDVELDQTLASVACSPTVTASSM